jgi:RimJ/RimL family protein N-acetyltransferase
MNGIRLEGERVVLREWRLDDRDAMYRVMGDAEVTRFLSWGRLTRAQCSRRLYDFISYQHSCLRQQHRGRWWYDSAVARALRNYPRDKAIKPGDSCDGSVDCYRLRYHLAIELLRSHRVIGETEFRWTSDGCKSRRGEVGYFLEREFWGHGYATEAALLMIEFAFVKLGASAVTAACDPRNQQSQRVMQKCGLERAPGIDETGPIVAAMTKARWLATRSPAQPSPIGLTP